MSQRIKHHFNVYVTAKAGPLNKESIRASEIAMAGILNTTMKMHGDPDLVHEVVYVETFDADKEDKGGEVSKDALVRMLTEAAQESHQAWCGKEPIEECEDSGCIERRKLFVSIKTLT